MTLTYAQSDLRCQKSYYVVYVRKELDIKIAFKNRKMKVNKNKEKTNLSIKI